MDSSSLPQQGGGGGGGEGHDKFAPSQKVVPPVQIFGPRNEDDYATHADQRNHIMNFVSIFLYIQNQQTTPPQRIYIYTQNILLGYNGYGFTLAMSRVKLHV